MNHLFDYNISFDVIFLQSLKINAFQSISISFDNTFDIFKALGLGYVWISESLGTNTELLSTKTDKSETYPSIKAIIFGHNLNTSLCFSTLLEVVLKVISDNFCPN
jgi:hypothetical protein